MRIGTRYPASARAALAIDSAAHVPLPQARPDHGRRDLRDDRHRRHRAQHRFRHGLPRLAALPRPGHPAARRHRRLDRVDPSLVGRPRRLPRAGARHLGLAHASARPARSSWARWPPSLLVGFQAWLGKSTVETGNSGESVTAHLATAMSSWLDDLPVPPVRSRYPAGLPARGAVQRLTLAGRVRRGLGLSRSCSSAPTCTASTRDGCAALVFPDWPLLDGQLIPTFSDDPAAAALQMAHFAHRIVAAIVGLIMLAATLVVLARRALTRERPTGPAPSRCSGSSARPPPSTPSRSSSGALQIWTTLAAWAVSLHLALGAAIWGLLAAAAFVGWYDARVPRAATGERSATATGRGRPSGRRPATGHAAASGSAPTSR